MKSCAFLLSMALLASLAADLRAQCRRGGGGTTSPGLTTSTGTAITSVLPVTSAETSYQMMQRMYAQEMQRAYIMQMQRAYMQQLQQEQESAAQAKAEKRQQRLTYWREYREAEQARREESKARNLARRHTDRALVSN